MSDRPLPCFRSPADQATRDLAAAPALLARFEDLWNQNLNAFTAQSIVGNPWQATYSASATNYFNPLDTVIPSTAPTAAIQWPALPGRIKFYNDTDWNGRFDQTAMWQLADFGWPPAPAAPNKQSFPAITKNPCTGAADSKPFGPYGPRGWQDEYCEWSVRRDPATNKIVRIDFTCENPEYWYTMWRVSPDVVVDLYRRTLDNAAITIDDLYLVDSHGQPVIDPSTGKPAYNPLNKWNCGPVATAAGGGAMHLTSTPNTLQTEVGLAGGATIQRTCGNSDPEVLICCAQYGQPYRNSDPQIGRVTNQVVSAGFTVTLADPPGLYIQLPDFSQYQLPVNAPKGASPADYWTVRRGVLQLNDMYGNPLPGNQILHAVFEVPAEQGFTVGDISIAGEKIQYGAQVAATFFMQINAVRIPARAPAAQPCVGSPSPGFPQPLQLFYTALWNAYYTQQAPANPVGFAMSLASNSVIVPPLVEQGRAALEMTIVCAGVQLGPHGELPSVSVDGANDIVATVVSLTDNVTYAVPGNSYPSTSQALAMTVSISPNATLGLRSLTIANNGQAAGAAAPAFLRVVPSSAATRTP